MNLKNGYNSGIDIVRLGVRGIVDVDWKSSTGNVDDGSLIEELREFLSLESSRGYDYFHLRSLHGYIFD